MKHLNPELQKLEQRIAPDLLDLGILLHVGCDCQYGTTANEDCSSGASCSHGSKSGHSGTGSSCS